jgi:hypothetical protein
VIKIINGENPDANTVILSIIPTPPDNAAPKPSSGLNDQKNQLMRFGCILCVRID